MSRVFSVSLAGLPCDLFSPIRPFFPPIQASGKFLVEIGRVVLINTGADAGKIATIVDFIDQNRVLIDGPSSGVVRRAESFKNIQLTRFVLNFPHGANSNFIKKLWDAEDINTKFAATPKAKQLVAKARVSFFPALVS